MGCSDGYTTPLKTPRPLSCALQGGSCVPGHFVPIKLLQKEKGLPLNMESRRTYVRLVSTPGRRAFSGWTRGQHPDQREGGQEVGRRGEGKRVGEERGRGGERERAEHAPWHCRQRAGRSNPRRKPERQSQNRFLKQVVHRQGGTGGVGRAGHAQQTARRGPGTEGEAGPLTCCCGLFLANPTVPGQVRAAWAPGLHL